jgi:hypothetical protein
MAKDIVTREEIKNKLLLSTNIKGNTAWHMAAGKGELDRLQKIWNWALDIKKRKYKIGC